MGEFYPFKQASKCYKKVDGRYYKTCVINNLEAMARYLSDLPREILGRNGKALKELDDFMNAIKQYGKETRCTELLPSPRHKLSNDKKAVHQIIQLMDEYRITDSNSFLYAL